jgi:hypothetical protein
LSHRTSRRKAFTTGQVASPLAGRPCDLRHAAISAWLNAGVPATTVAKWAGNSVQVLHRTYAKCIEGQDELALRKIENVRGPAFEPPAL